MNTRKTPALKLSLNKQTIAKLNNEQMSDVNGASVDISGDYCYAVSYAVSKAVKNTIMSSIDCVLNNR